MPELQSTISNGVKMVKVKIIASLFFIFYASCTFSTIQESKAFPSQTPKRELKKHIPNAYWVKVYFEEIEDKSRPGLDKTAKQNGFSILRETVLPENDLEIRVWVGFGIYGNDGLIFKRSSGNWSAVNLRGMLCHSDKKGNFNLETPKSGWETTWRKLVDAGILTLPDSSEIDYDNNWNDGKSFVIETNYDYVYRTYQYANPKYEKAKQAKQIIKIGKIIVDEFGLKNFSAEKSGCEADE